MTFSRKLKGKSRQVLRSTSDQIGSSAKTNSSRTEELGRGGGDRKLTHHSKVL
jgi:hypothetical protein